MAGDLKERASLNAAREAVQVAQSKRNAAQTEYVAAARRLRLAERDLDDAIDHRDALIEEDANG